MNLLLNILFEKLHRAVYDKVYIHDSYRHHGNQLTKIDLLKEKLYNFILPYFEGWRYSLKINLPFVKKYQRYEPKNLDLLNYEIEKLNLWNKKVYRLRKAREKNKAKT